MDEELIRLKRLNEKLLQTLSELLYEIVRFCEINNISLPNKIHLLLATAKKLIIEQYNKKIIIKPCYVCGKLNPEDAKFCAYCGTTLDIFTRIRHDDKSPEDTTEPYFAHKHRFFTQSLYTIS